MDIKACLDLYFPGECECHFRAYWPLVDLSKKKVCSEPLPVFRSLFLPPIVLWILKPGLVHKVGNYSITDLHFQPRDSLHK